MRFRSVLVVATCAATFLVGGVAVADNIDYDADTLTAGVQGSTLDLGAVACGVATSRTVDVWVNKNGAGTNVYGNGSTVDVSASASAPLSVVVPAGAAGDIAMPADWSQVGNNTDSARVRVTVTLTSSTAGAGTGSVSLTGTGVNGNGAALVRSTTLDVSWTTGSCAPVKTATTTSITCPTSVVYDGTAQTPCTATTTGSGGFTASPTLSYGANTAAGTVSVSASYPGDATHLESSDATTFRIDKAPSTTVLTCADAIYTGSALEPCSATVEGAGVVTGSAVVTYTDNVDAGTATADATYAGDANHTGSEAQQSFSVGQAAAHCTVEGSTATYDGLAHGLSGSCTGTDGSVVGTLDLGGSVTDAGSSDIPWSFDGGRNYADQTGVGVVTIERAPSSVEISCPESVVYDGDAQTPCSATVTGAGGLSESVAVEYASNVAAGTAGASARYDGGRNHLADSATATFEIEKAPSTVTLTCSDGPHVYTGSPVTPCTARVTGAGGLDEALTPSYEDNVDAGSAGVSAAYNGDDNHTGASDTRTFRIDRAPSTTTVSCESGPFVYTGSAFEPCSASVTGAGGLAESLAVSYTANTDAGTATAEAAYGGDRNHLASSGSTTFAIAKAPTTVTVTCAPGPYYFTGSPITPACTARATGAGGLDVAVSPVTFADNTAVGTATAGATYAGDANHLGSTGTTTFTVSAWTVRGYFQPVAMPTDVAIVWNTVKNGSTVPLKFELFSGPVERTNVADIASVRAFAVTCTAGAEDVMEEAVTTTGGTTLRYDSTAGQFVNNWQTPKKAGTCYRVTTTALDGSAVTAYFKLK